MTVTSSIATIADSVAALSVTGVTFKDIDQIPDTARMLCPLFIPDPSRFVTGYGMTFETFGSNGAAKMNSTYTLNYLYLHCEAGSGINAFAPYAGLISKLSAVLVAIFSNDAITGAVDIALESVGEIGIITDPAGVEYWGVQVTLKVLEYNQ
jgi:hypothetical protein